MLDSIVSELEFNYDFGQVQHSLHCTQFHQKLASCWAHVVEILSWVRELKHTMCKINVFFKATQVICY